MEPAYFAIAVMLLSLPLSIFILRHAIRKQATLNRELQETLGAIAADVGGEVGEASWNRRPDLRFTHRDQTTRLLFYSTGGKHPQHYTQLKLDLGGLPVLKVNIYPQTGFSALGAFLGFQDVEVGDKPFDDAFVIKADDPEVARTFLDAETRAAILALGELNQKRGTSVYVRGSELIVSLRGYLREADALRGLVDEGRKVLDGYLRTMIS